MVYVRFLAGIDCDMVARLSADMDIVGQERRVCGGAASNYSCRNEYANGESPDQVRSEYSKRLT